MSLLLLFAVHIVVVVWGDFFRGLYLLLLILFNHLKKAYIYIIHRYMYVFTKYNNNTTFAHTFISGTYIGIM